MQHHEGSPPLTSRPHDPPGGEQGSGPGGADHEQLVAVASFGTREEAEAAQEMLELAGIPTMLRANDFSGLIPTSIVDHEVLVPPSDLQRARQLLECESLSEDDEGGEGS